jgi:DNA/RNA endonuclease G (NUC1)
VSASCSVRAARTHPGDTARPTFARRARLELREQPPSLPSGGVELKYRHFSVIMSASRRPPMLTAAAQANRDTFHFTNSCPQMIGVNQQTWLGLEDYILDHAHADGMRVNVYTGPYFAEQDLSGELQGLGFVYAGYKTYQISVRSVIERTNIDFGALVPYDGFSHHERTTGQRIAEALDSLDAIRI